MHRILLSKLVMTLSIVSLLGLWMIGMLLTRPCEESSVNFICASNHNYNCTHIGSEWSMEYCAGMPCESLWLEPVDGQVDHRGRNGPRRLYNWYGVTVLTHPKSSKEITAIAVCGGLGDDRRVFNVVEVFSYPASQWYVAEPLPTPLWGITSTTVGTTTYLVGGVDSIIYGTSHCFSVSVDSIIKQATTSKVSQFQHGSEWTPITNPPLISSCAASMDNIVMAIGGWDSSTRSSTAIYFLNERGSWERIWGGGLPRPLGKSTAVCLPSGELMIVGGIGSNGLSSCPLFFGSIDD